LGIGTAKLGSLTVSRLILGGNPFSGYSHQGDHRDQEMMDWYTVGRIKETYRQAERLGINSHIGRADHHIMRVLREYWNEGGNIQWIAQTCPELGSMAKGIENALNGGAMACFLHGGFMDFLLANSRLEEVRSDLAKIRNAGLPAGIAGHDPRIFEWAEENLDLDFYACSYHNPFPRKESAEYRPMNEERFVDEDRHDMVRVIKDLNRPVIHYKVIAGGRKDPQEALRFVANHLRPQDAVCIGIYTKDKMNMLEENLTTLETLLR